MCHVTKIVHLAYTLTSSLDFHLLFENCITYNYKISYTVEPRYKEVGYNKTLL